jgi:hypothetical protein
VPYSYTKISKTHTANAMNPQTASPALAVRPQRTSPPQAYGSNLDS